MDHYEMILKDRGDTVIKTKGHSPEVTKARMEEHIKEKYHQRGE